MKFKGRRHFHNIKVRSKAASADVEATASHPEDVAKITQERRYAKQQSFSVDATILDKYRLTCPSVSAIFVKMKSPTSCIVKCF